MSCQGPDCHQNRYMLTWWCHLFFTDSGTQHTKINDSVHLKHIIYNFTNNASNSNHQDKLVLFWQYMKKKFISRIEKGRSAYPPYCWWLFKILTPLKICYGGRQSSIITGSPHQQFWKLFLHNSITYDIY